MLWGERDGDVGVCCALVSLSCMCGGLLYVGGSVLAYNNDVQKHCYQFMGGPVTCGTGMPMCGALLVFLSPFPYGF